MIRMETDISLERSGSELSESQVANVSSARTNLHPVTRLLIYDTISPVLELRVLEDALTNTFKAINRCNLGSDAATGAGTGGRTGGGGRGGAGGEGSGRARDAPPTPSASYSSAASSSFNSSSRVERVSEFR